jgi:phosphoglycerate kinase
LPKLLPSACGFLLEKEIKYLSQLLENPERPFIAILGGAKVSDKIGVINNLLEKVDAFLIGGGMAYTFLKAEQIEVGDSLVEEEKLEVAREIKRKAAEKGVKILLPLDHLVAQEITPEAEVKETEGIKILPGWKGVDIGSTTQKTYLSLVKEAKTVLWNGPLGVFEIGQFAQGSLIIAKHLAEISQEGATVVIGGGDTIALVTKAGVKDKLTHLSTGGGALLEFLEGKELPGIKALIPE